MGYAGVRSLGQQRLYSLLRPKRVTWKGWMDTGKRVVNEAILQRANGASRDTSLLLCLGASEVSASRSHPTAQPFHPRLRPPTEGGPHHRGPGT